MGLKKGITILKKSIPIVIGLLLFFVACSADEVALAVQDAQLNQVASSEPESESEVWVDERRLTAVNELTNNNNPSLVRDILEVAINPHNGETLTHFSLDGRNVNIQIEYGEPSEHHISAGTAFELWLRYVGGIATLSGEILVLSSFDEYWDTITFTIADVGQVILTKENIINTGRLFFGQEFRVMDEDFIGDRVSELIGWQRG